MNIGSVSIADYLADPGRSCKLPLDPLRFHHRLLSRLQSVTDCNFARQACDAHMDSDKMGGLQNNGCMWNGGCKRNGGKETGGGWSANGVWEEEVW